MTLPDQAVNKLGQHSMYFQDVEIKITYQLMTFKRKSSPKGLTCNTHISEKLKKQRREKGY